MTLERGRFLLAGAVLLVGVSGGVDAGEEGELDAQGRQLAVLEKHVRVLAQVQRDHEDRINALERAQLETERLFALAEELKSELARVRSDTARLADEFSGYKENYRVWIRSSARGERHDELQTLSGNHYRDVTIREVTDAGLEIRHLNGTARVLHSDLPPQFQERFQWNQSVAEGFLKAEQEREKLRDRLLAVSARQRAQEEEQRERAERSERRITELESEVERISSLQRSALRGSVGRLGETRAVGTGSRRSGYYYSRYSRNRPTIYYYPVRSVRAPSRASGTRFNARTWMNRPRSAPAPRPMPMCPGGGD